MHACMELLRRLEADFSIIGEFEVMIKLTAKNLKNFKTRFYPKGVTFET